MKKYLLIALAAILALTLCFCLFSCTDKNDPDGDGDGGEPDPSTGEGTGEDDPPELTGITFADLTVLYDGTSKSIQIGGTLPSGVTVQYEGNAQTNAGIYTVTAKFYYNNSHIDGADKTATLKIDKATVDMSGVTFTGATKSYDGASVTPAVSGTLPSGVSVSYEVEDGKTIKNAGSYKVKAKFTLADTANYNAIPDMEATFTVTKAEHDISGVTFSDVTRTYNGSAVTPTVTGYVPNGVTVSYEVDGGKTIKDVGAYTVKARFTVGDTENYNEITTVLTATYQINKATYDMSGVTFSDVIRPYNGAAVTPSVSGTLPSGVTVSYEVENGATIKEIGSYNVKAKFTVADTQNYNTVSDMEATYTVTVGTYDMSGVSFASFTKTYDGVEVEPKIGGTLPSGVSVTYEVEGGKTIKNADVYKVKAKFTIEESEKYNAIPDMEATITISKATYDMSGITFTGTDKTYDGVETVPTITGELPIGVTVVYSPDNITIKDVGTYYVTASFTGDAVNYEPISSITATFNITAVTYDTAGKLTSVTVPFDGQYHSITLSDSPSQFITVKYDGNNVRNVGTYTVTVSFSGDTKNCVIPDAITATITVTRGTYVTPELTYALRDDGTYEVTGYTGTLDYVMLPDTYEGEAVTSIKSNAFADNTVITYVYIPDSVTNIGNKAFGGCTSLTEIRMSEKVEIIGSQAFLNVSIKEAKLPDTLTVIGQGAFKGTAIESITLPFIGGSRSSSNKYLGYIFGGVNGQFVPSSLKTVTLSDACTEIPAYALSGCSYISNVVLGSGIESIGNSAFANCTSLRSIYIPDNVTSVPANTYWYNSPFMGCSDDFMIVNEGGFNSEYGQYWDNITETKKALVIYMKEYEDYLKNGESFRNVDMTDASAEAIYVDGELISGFASETTAYTVNTDINVGYKNIRAIASSAAAKVYVTQANYANGGVATVTVTSGDGQNVKVYTVTFNVSGTLTASGVVVNKNGADATVTYVIDDGDKTTGTFAKNMLNKYSFLNLSFAIWTKDFVTLTENDDDTEYVMDGERYTYTQTDAQKSTVAFWQDILSMGRTEIVSHTHTHSFWGTNDDGGEFTYVKNDGTVATATMPKGSVTKELYASKQILKDMFPSSLYPNMRYVSLIEPGISVKTYNQTVDGETIPTYKTYYDQLVKQAIENGEYIGSRSTFQTQSTAGSASKVILPTTVDTVDERMKVPAYMIVNSNKNASKTDGNIENWTAYIDHAIEQNGWACYCIHKITAAHSTGHYILQSEAEELFAYTEDKNVWVATFTDAMLYYSEWSTSNVVTEYEDGKVKVTLTDDENDAVYNAELTVKVNVPAIWDSAKVGDDTLEVHVNSDGSRYVYVNIVPDSGTVEIIGG